MNRIGPELAQAVVKVGDGRGFIVQDYVVTAAHCLPNLPPPHGANALEDLTFGNLLGPVDASPTVWAECSFADPVADIAVLCSPDTQELSEHADAYEQLLADRPALQVGDVPVEQETTAWVLTLDSRWVRCTVRRHPRALWIENASEGIKAGMSGSPVLDENAAAIGVVSTAALGFGTHGPNPVLTYNLPAGLLRGFLPNLSSEVES